VPPRDFVPIKEALQGLRKPCTYSHVRRLIREGQVAGRKVDGFGGDARVKMLVSRKSLRAHLNKESSRASNRRRNAWPLYTTYKAMVGRCHYPSYPSYKTYGAEGIKVCPEWAPGGKETDKGYFKFLGYVCALPGFGKQDDEGRNYQLDRIDNSKGYEPGNVQWSSRADQSKNRRKYRRKKSVEQAHADLDEAAYQAAQNAP